jgi:hypothetical protein
MVLRAKRQREAHGIDLSSTCAKCKSGVVTLIEGLPTMVRGTLKFFGFPVNFPVAREFAPHKNGPLSEAPRLRNRKGLDAGGAEHWRIPVARISQRTLCREAPVACAPLAQAT